MYKVLKSSNTGVDEFDIEDMEKGCWIDIVSPSTEEIDEIANATQISRDFLTAALDREEKARTEIDEEQLLVVIDIPFFRSNKDYDTMPLGIIVTKDVIVTVCLESNAVTSGFNAQTYKMFSTYKKTRFLFQILYKSATLYLKYIRNIIRRTDDLESHLRQAMENSKLFSMLDLQKSLTYFTTSLRSIVEYKQAIEMVEMYSHILQSMMEVFASIISNNLNLVMRFLASVTIILSIPTLISGLWGMNVPVPFAEVASGFFIVFGITCLVSLLAGFWLWKKHMF